MGKIIGEGITFDDVLLVPSYSEVIPNQVDLSTYLTKKIKLNISAHTKKIPPRKIEVGIFYAFVMWFACAYFAGRTMTCPS